MSFFSPLLYFYGKNALFDVFSVTLVPQFCQPSPVPGERLNFLRAKPMKTLSVDEQIMHQKKYPWTLLKPANKGYIVLIEVFQIFLLKVAQCTRVKNNRSVDTVLSLSMLMSSFATLTNRSSILKLRF